MPQMTAARDDTPPIVIRSFDDLHTASLARRRLEEAGIARERVAVQILDDEAGPVEGNFVAGNGRSEPTTSPSRGLVIGDRLEYEDNFRNAVNRSTHIVSVRCDGEPARARATQILETLGGRDPHQARR